VKDLASVFEPVLRRPRAATRGRDHGQCLDGKAKRFRG
jgi:hypothetical protein